MIKGTMEFKLAHSFIKAMNVDYIIIVLLITYFRIYEAVAFEIA